MAKGSSVAANSPFHGIIKSMNKGNAGQDIQAIEQEEK